MLRDLGLARALSAGETHPTKIITEPETAAIYAELSDDPLAADELVAKCRLDERAIMEKLTALELDGLAERLPGGTYVRSSRASETTEQS
jgi:predicted Rossmann fold nucleotide-binding protein DprA/Smf involved in DNA uptake